MSGRAGTGPLLSLFVLAGVLFFCEIYMILAYSLGAAEHVLHVLTSPSVCFVHVSWMRALLDGGLGPRSSGRSDVVLHVNPL